MITVKETARMYGVILLMMCAVIMASLFFGYYFEMKDMGAPADPQSGSIYDSQLQMSLITASVSTSMLAVFALLAALFSLSDYISKNRPNMGILKALGYDDITIAMHFSKTGIPVMIGSLLGLLMSAIIGPTFYSSMSDSLFSSPGYSVRPVLFILLTLIPAAVFAVFSVSYAYMIMRKPPLDLIKGSDSIKQSKRIRGINRKYSGSEFSVLMRKIMLRSYLLVPIFVFIASWGYSATVQMGFTMRSIDMSEFGALLCGSIGVLLGIVMMILAEHTVMKKNSKNITIMKAFGYSEKECLSYILSDCRKIAIAGFIIGTPYQYFQMKFMVSLYATPVEVSFSWIGLILTLVSFIAIYEAAMYMAKKKINDISIKETMMTVS